MNFRKMISHILLICMIFGFVNIETVTHAEDVGINVLNAENADFTIMSSAGTVESDKVFDGDKYTTVSLSEYNGIKIFDRYGNKGSDYSILLTVDTSIPLPAEIIRLYVKPNRSSYLGKATAVYPVGVDVFSVDDKQNYNKIYSTESLENELKNEPWDKEYWTDQRPYFTYYDFKPDSVVNTQKIVIGIKSVEPWLGSISFGEVCFFAPDSSIPKEYKNLNVITDNDSKVILKGEKQISESLFLPKTLVYGEVQPKKGYVVKAVTVSGSLTECENNKFSFEMPDGDAELKIETAVEESLDVPLAVTECGLMNGDVVSGEVPVIYYNFSTRINQLNKENVCVNGVKNSPLVQQVFTDALDDTKAYVVLFKDKLEAGQTYNVSLVDPEGINHSKLTNTEAVPVTVPKGYVASSGYSSEAFIFGYEDGTFRPENNITINEALAMAKRLSAGSDFESIEASDMPATRLDMAEIIYILKNGNPVSDKEDMFISLVNDGIIKGYEDGSYGRERLVTRSEAAVMFIRISKRNLNKLDTENSVVFKDVNEDYWAYNEILLASAKIKVTDNINWEIKDQNIEFDVYNEKENIWEQIPMVTAEQREMGILGGEGGQWMQSIEVDQVDGTLLFGGVDVNAMIRSTDGGKTWHRSNRGFEANGCVDTAIDPNNKNRVLAVGACGSTKPQMNGVYLSEDMGDSWVQVHSRRMDAQRDSREQLAWDKSSYDEEIGGSRIAYWSSLWRVPDSVHNNPPVHKSDEVGGLFKTEDGGKTWFLVNEEMSDGYIEVNPENGWVYVGNDKGFHISKDGGKTFITKLSGEPVMSVDVILTRPNNVYISDSRGVMISENGGNTFTRVSSKTFPGKTDFSDLRNVTMGLQVSPANPDYMLVDRRDFINYGNSRYVSHDGGKNWTQCAYDTSKDFFFAHNRQHVFAWHPTDENKVWSLGGDWIVSSNDGGMSFIWDANGYCGVPPASRANFNPYMPDVFYAGAQDLDGIITYDGGYTWKPLEAAGKYWNAFGSYAVDENLFFAGLSDGWYNPRYLCVTRDGGETWTDTGLYLKNGTARWATSFWQSLNNPNVLFAGEYYSTDRAETWKEMNGCIGVLAINYYHNKEIYGTCGGGCIVVSYDDGETWLPFAMCKIDDESIKGKSDIFGSGITIWDMEYDGINDILYYAVGNWSSARCLGKIQNNEHTQLTRNIVEQTTRGTITFQLTAIDPNYPDIIYIAGYVGDGMALAGVQRSCDGGKTFQNICSMGDETSIVKNGPSAGVGPQQMVVNPFDGYLWIWDAGQGWWKFAPPYQTEN